jgi:glycosyltransferase involved in cell wall biosynthesis
VNLSIIIPWQDKAGDPGFRRAAEFVIDHYRSLNIGEVVVGTYPVDDEPLNRSRLRNEGAKLATGDVLAFVDAEILVPTDQLLEAARLALEAPGVVFPHSYAWTYITPEQNEQIYEGAPFEQFIEKKISYWHGGKIPRHWMVSPVSVISRDGFEKIGGWDEEFVGWGEEDRLYNWKANFELGPLRLVDGGFIHVNHTDKMDKQDNHIYFQEGTEENRLFRENIERFRRKALLVRPLKIAVYAAGKNVEGWVEDWVSSAADADHVVLLDGGSTDATVQVARDAGATVTVQKILPWRWDVALTVALSHVPDDVDVCVMVKPDERLGAGWRADLTRAWLDGSERFMVQYQQYREVLVMEERAHSRHGWSWKYPVFPALSGEGFAQQTQVKIARFEDASGPVVEDPALVELLLKENPEVPYAFYHATRYYFETGDWTKGRDLAVKLLRESAYPQMRSEVCLVMADMVFDYEREKWLLQAAAEEPSRREPWERLADHYLIHDMFEEAAGAASRCLRIGLRPKGNDFRRTRQAWDDDLVKRTYLTAREPVPQS